MLNCDGRLFISGALLAHACGSYEIVEIEDTHQPIFSTGRPFFAYHGCGRNLVTGMWAKRLLVQMADIALAKNFPNAYFRYGGTSEDFTDKFRRGDLCDEFQ